MCGIDTFNWSLKGVALKEDQDSMIRISGLIARTVKDDYFDIATKDPEVLYNSKL